MPANPNGYFEKMSKTAADWREEAAKYERLADMAQRDGDHFHAEVARKNAAQCRQNARLKDLEP